MHKLSKSNADGRRISPYLDRPSSSFWRKAVVGRTTGQLEGMYKPRHRIDRQTPIATAGSCFAQHIANNLRVRGFNVVDAEPPPPGLLGREARDYGFCLYSARHGNIYLVRQLLQLLLESIGEWAPADIIWVKDGRYFDALRPSVEPHGLATPEEVFAQRECHLQRFRRVVASAEVFVFTLGLTEGWVHRQSGTVYPTAPGTIAGVYDPETYAFRNFTFAEIYDDFSVFRERARALNPKIRFLLTVSPVPLAATASDQHVLVATAYSKAVLRAVAGQLCTDFSDVDYFPSFELITAPVSGSAYFEEDLRSVSSEGVALVMNTFLQAYGIQDAEPVPAAEGAGAPVIGEDVMCEEALVEALGS